MILLLNSPFELLPIEVISPLQIVDSLLHSSFTPLNILTGFAKVLFLGLLVVIVFDVFEIGCESLHELATG